LIKCFDLSIGFAFMFIIEYDIICLLFDMILFCLLFDINLFDIY